ncbi:MAG: hypothetical protein P1Q69_19265, partial [Candidatus Thorarchaeota archaeon]|nr:hypothetical protein [Candidatus Thorarchaeota archaeon]
MEERVKVLLFFLVIVLGISLVNPAVDSAKSNEVSIVQNPINSDYMGEPPMITEGVNNWDFEQADSYGRPAGDWDSSAYAFTRGNISTDVESHTGSRSASLEVTPSVGDDYLSLVSNNLDVGLYVRVGMDLSVWIHPDTMNSEIATYIYIYYENSTGYDFYNYYMLIDPSWWSTGNYSYSNYAYTYFDRTDILVQGQWNQFQTDLYADLLEVFTTLDSSTRISNIQFYCFVEESAPSKSLLYVDDISINNGTEHVSNGDFESSSNLNWYFQSNNHDPGYLSLSNVSTEGDHSLNITTLSITNDTFSYAQVSVIEYSHFNQWFATTAINTILEFDWQVEFSGLSNDHDQLSYIEISLVNLTTYNWYSIYYLFCSGGSTLWGANDTDDLYLRAPEYNVSSVWHHTTLDLYSIALDQGWGNLSVSEF